MFQVDGPITRGAQNRDFTVLQRKVSFGFHFSKIQHRQ